MISKFFKPLYGRRLAFGKRNHDIFKSENDAFECEITQATAEAFVVWEEPNRANTPELQIGQSGGRYSTITGAWWLDSETFIANHRSGLRMAIFDMSAPEDPVWKSEIGYPSDDIAAKRISPTAWEVAISGCWDCVYGRYRIERSDGYKVDELEILNHKKRDFCHGVAYNAQGELCYTIHTGNRPRLQLGDETHTLPYPWGARDVCYDRARNRYIAVAVSANPRKEAYGGVRTSLWTCVEGTRRWNCLGVYENVHSDALDVWKGRIWIPDQVDNRLLAINAESGEVELIGSGDALDFPHGLGISEAGKIAITNYGSSSVAVVDADALSKGHLANN